MAHSKSLRVRKDVDYELLHNGNFVNIIDHIDRNLSGEYLIERIIARRVNKSAADEYLVKWSGYHKDESTWEPTINIPNGIIESFLSPTISQERLNEAAQNIESSFEKRLTSRSFHHQVNIDLDIYRYMFHTDDAVIVSSYKSISDKLPVSDSWFYVVKKNLSAVKVSLPIRFVPSLRSKKKRVISKGKVTSLLTHVETIKIISSIEPYNYDI